MPQEPWMRAIEIHFYGRDAPIALPMPEAKVAAAQACFERVRSDVIEAQRHNDRRVEIGPFGQARDALVLDPCMIKQVVLVDEPTSDS